MFMYASKLIKQNLMLNVSKLLKIPKYLLRR